LLREILILVSLSGHESMVQIGSKPEPINFGIMKNGRPWCVLFFFSPKTDTPKERKSSDAKNSILGLKSLNGGR
jgi:hypothetical protein